MGPEDSGMYLFRDDAGPEDAIVTGFGLEMGLRDFYVGMQAKVVSREAQDLFEKLAEIEILHQKQLLELYSKATGRAITIEEFQANIVEPAMEGGLTTDQYLERYNLDTESELEILSLAMAIEVQALDLYLRAAGNSTEAGTKDTLYAIAEEERSHITMLGQRIDQQQELT